MYHTQYPRVLKKPVKMRGLIIFLAVNLAAFAGAIDQPVVIPSLQNPHLVNFIYADGLQIYNQHCVGSIINNYAILSSALCLQSYQPHQVRVRVGSNFGGAFGTVYQIASLVAHPDRGSEWLVHRENDIGIAKVASPIEFWSNAQPATFGIQEVPENSIVETYGYAYIEDFLYEDIHKQSSRVITSLECSRRYQVPNADNIHRNVLCSIVRIEDPEGWYPLVANYGSPLYHNGVVVGVANYLDNPGFPVSYAIVGKHIDWIRANA